MYEQLSLPMNLNSNNYVVQANDLISGKQTLTLNEAKILRLAIMQIVKEDKQFKPYRVKITDLAEILGIDSSNIYRDIDKITDGLMSKFVKIKDKNKPNSKSFLKFKWVDYCKYTEGTGIIEIKLYEGSGEDKGLRPYLLGLKEYYAQYPLENILAMNSVYAIRVFELLQAKITQKTLPKDGVLVRLTVDEIRAACECEDKFTQFGMFRKKVVDIAKKEIERVTLFTVDFKYVKEGRKVVAFDILVNMKYH